MFIKIIIGLCCFLIIFFILQPTEYARNYSPGEQYYLIAKSSGFNHFNITMPGDGGGHYNSGIIQLFTKTGKKLEQAPIRQVNLIHEVEWNRDSVSIPFTKEWKLPKTIQNFNEKDYILEEVAKNGLILNKASEVLKNDKEVVLMAVQNQGRALCAASKTLKNAKEIVLIAIQNDANALSCASEKLKDNEEVVLSAIQQRISTLQYASHRLQEKLKTYIENKQLILSMVQKNGQELQYASTALKNDKDIVLAAVQQYPDALQYASEELRDDYTLVFTAISHQYGGCALQWASSRLKDNETIVLAATSGNCSGTLLYASERLRLNQDFLLKVIAQSWLETEFIPDKLKDNEAFMLRVKEIHSAAFRYYASDKVKKKVGE